MILIINKIYVLSLGYYFLQIHKIDNQRDMENVILRPRVENDILIFEEVQCESGVKAESYEEVLIELTLQRLINQLSMSFDDIGKGN
jgi:hypothetical protein